MRALLAGILLAVGACSPNTGGAAASQAAPSVHPVSGLEVFPLTVTSGKTRHAFRVELAASPRDQWLHRRLALIRPAALAQFAHQIALKLGRAGGKTRNIGQCQLFKAGTVERSGLAAYGYHRP